MITLEWNVLVYGLIMLVGIGYLLFGESEDSGGYISIPILKPIVFIGLIIYTLIWGGIYWW